jgi:hypothetical protein
MDGAEFERLANLQFSTYHLSEAISELNDLLSAVRDGKIVDRDDVVTQAKIAHAYQHLNWFWNGQARKVKSSAVLGPEEFNSFSVFPLELMDSMAIQSESLIRLAQIYSKTPEQSDD